ncbi:hypothetical protein QYE76_001686 [Lolium multiflorum]|uniref:Ribonuclease H1 N-terminal domain-containing protein n=1 Tax=Lolium multiflorum TaxID=4521 RepID=A0AAD8RP78_LOLMU|nr:hypothetical protein QYE76_001686 [Lolium multiflorum]
MEMPTTYVVYKGRVPGVYDDWEDCRRQVHRFSGNSYKGYPTRVEAEGRYARYLAGEMRDMRRNRMKTMAFVMMVIMTMLMEPNEPISAKFYQLGNGGSLVFEHDLNAVSAFLGRLHPEFHGIQVNDQPGGELQWIITADLRGTMESPNQERILFSFVRATARRMARALQEALARLCGQNVVRLLASRFAHLVRRDASGVPMTLQSTRSCGTMPST